MGKWIKEEFPLIAAWTLAIGAGVLFLLPMGFNLIYETPYNFTDYATFVGGTAGPMAALAGFLFIYLTFQHQQEQLTEQKQQFALQSFEGTFFKLLEYYRIERDNVEGLFNAKGKNAIKDIMTVRLNHEIPNSHTDLPTSGLPYFHSLFNNHRISLSEYLRAFHILLTFIEEHQRYNYLQFLSAYMDEHEKVFHAYYYGTIGLPTQRDLVAEFGFLKDVERFVFNFPDDYHTILNIPPPEEVDWSDSPGDII